MIVANSHSPKNLPRPLPAPGMEAYLWEKESALSFSVRRRENYECYLSSNRREARVNYQPTVLDIENVSRCNFHCLMCVVSTYPRGKRARDMSLDEFKRLMDDEFGLVEIKLHGTGEPLLQGELFFEMIRYARTQHIWVRAVTNGSLLHLNENYKKLVESGVNEIQVSIDGADKEIYESIRRGGLFEKVVENCKRLNDYCHEKGRVLTKMWTMVQKRNHHQLEDLVQLAHDLHFTNQVFSLHLHNWGGCVDNDENKAGVLEKERLLALVDLGLSVGVKVSFWDINEKYSTRSKETLCPWPFERAFVTSDLRTVPCCMISNPDAFELGKGRRFTEVWNSEEYVAFRQAHLDGDIPEICRTCYSD